MFKKNSSPRAISNPILYRCNVLSYYLFHLFLRRTKEYFTYTTKVNITVGGKRALPNENPLPSSGCCNTLQRITGEETSKSWVWTHFDRFIEKLLEYCAALENWATEPRRPANKLRVELNIILRIKSTYKYINMQSRDHLRKFKALM